uniref:Uncharacterized protein n=1 Tax=Arundo donax TaxID=35708 RepID=A0A0A9FKI3_ARUDO
MIRPQTLRTSLNCLHYYFRKSEKESPGQS